MESQMIRRILFLGGESSGKTTMTNLVAEKYGIYSVEEYGRRFYEERPGKAYEYEDLDLIGLEQAKLEETAYSKTLDEQKFATVSDTSLLVTYFYSMEWFGKSSNRLRMFAIPLLQTYTDIFLCANDFAFVQDGQRQGIDFSTKQFEFYKYVMDACGIPYTVLSGGVGDRLNIVSAILSKE